MYGTQNTLFQSNNFTSLKHNETGVKISQNTSSSPHFNADALEAV